jgi:hypothetical protein
VTVRDALPDVSVRRRPGFGDGLDLERTPLDDESREYLFVTRRIS